MADFIPGLKLGELFCREVVEPILAAEFPDLPYSAALIGSGSEVLGFDTDMSTDHHWGPRAMLFLREDAYADYAPRITDIMRQRLPYAFRGYPTNFTAPDPDDNGTQLLAAVEQGPINHRIEVFTLRGFFMKALGWDSEAALQPADWLTFPQQALREATAGAVYHDGIGLEAIRARLAYYPHDVWLYLLAAGWARIGQEEPFVGRAGDVGDEIGSAIIAGRLARDLMMLGFLMEKVYAPYPKWFGTAFARLACAPALLPVLRRALAAETWRAREEHLCRAYEQVAALHNALGITGALPAQVSRFHGRPYRVIHGERFADALAATIADDDLRRLAAGRLIGSVDQLSDSTDVRSDASVFRQMRGLYE